MSTPIKLTFRNQNSNDVKNITVNKTEIKTEQISTLPSKPLVNKEQEFKEYLTKIHVELSRFEILPTEQKKYIQDIFEQATNIDAEDFFSKMNIELKKGQDKAKDSGLLGIANLLDEITSKACLGASEQIAALVEFKTGDFLTQEQKQAIKDQNVKEQNKTEVNQQIFDLLL
jgi:hypothetical protein